MLSSPKSVLVWQAFAVILESPFPKVVDTHRSQVIFIKPVADCDLLIVCNPGNRVYREVPKLAIEHYVSIWGAGMIES